MRNKHSLSPNNITPTVRDLFWSKVGVPDDPDACWTWTGSMLPKRKSHNGFTGGYGRISAKYGDGLWRVEYAHRISYALHSGETIPPGMVVMHICDNPPCCNPAHLRLGTYSDNSLDRERKNRRPNPVRPEHRDDPIIRRMYESGMTVRELADMYSVATMTMYQRLARAGTMMRQRGAARTSRRH